MSDSQSPTMPERSLCMPLGDIHLSARGVAIVVEAAARDLETVLANQPR